MKTNFRFQFFFLERLLDFRRPVGAPIFDATARTPRRERFLTRRASLPRWPSLSQKEARGIPIPRGIPRDLVKFVLGKRVFYFFSRKIFLMFLDFRRHMGALIGDSLARTPRCEGFLIRRASLPRRPPLSQKEPEGTLIPRGIPRDLVKFGFRKKKKNDSSF